MKAEWRVNERCPCGVIFLSQPHDQIACATTLSERLRKVRDFREERNKTFTIENLCVCVENLSTAHGGVTAFPHLIGAQNIIGCVRCGGRARPNYLISVGQTVRKMDMGGNVRTHWNAHLCEICWETRHQVHFCPERLMMAAECLRECKHATLLALRRCGLSNRDVRKIVWKMVFGIFVPCYHVSYIKE